MRRSIVVIMCICFLTSMLSSCGSKTDTVTESNNLMEKDKTSTMENGGGVEAADTAEYEAEQLDWMQAYLEKTDDLREPEAYVGNEYPDVPEVYRNVLWQYAQVIREDVDWDTFYERHMNGE